MNVPGTPPSAATLFLTCAWNKVCSVCIDGYTASSEYTCARCTDEMAGLVTAVFFIVISAIVLIILVLYMVSDEKPVESGVADRRVSSYLQIRYQSLKIVLVTLQLLAQVRKGKRASSFVFSVEMSRVFDFWSNGGNPKAKRGSFCPRPWWSHPERQRGWS